MWRLFREESEIHTSVKVSLAVSRGLSALIVCIRLPNLLKALYCSCCVLLRLRWEYVLLFYRIAMPKERKERHYRRNDKADSPTRQSSPSASSGEEGNESESRATRGSQEKKEGEVRKMMKSRSVQK